MKATYFLTTLLTMIMMRPLKAQNNHSDSLNASIVLNKLLTICKNVDFADPKVKDSGMFYKATPYIVYRGEDKKRAWKDFANYNNQSEKKGVDEICYKINSTVNQDSSYKIIKYFTEKESEGIWHVLMIAYRKKGIEKKAAFAFLKINTRFGLGDID